VGVFKRHQTSCIFLSGRFDAVEDSFLTPILQSAARRVYSRSMPLKNRKNCTPKSQIILAMFIYS